MITENQAREQLICPACGAYKTAGCVVCWGCFKHIDNPLKYTELSWELWLSQQRIKNGL